MRSKLISRMKEALRLLRVLLDQGFKETPAVLFLAWLNLFNGLSAEQILPIAPTTICLGKWIKTAKASPQEPWANFRSAFSAFESAPIREILAFEFRALNFFHGHQATKTFLLAQARHRHDSSRRVAGHVGERSGTLHFWHFCITLAA